MIHDKGSGPENPMALECGSSDCSFGCHQRNSTSTQFYRTVKWASVCNACHSHTTLCVTAEETHNTEELWFPQRLFFFILLKRNLEELIKAVLGGGGGGKRTCLPHFPIYIAPLKQLGEVAKFSRLGCGSLIDTHLLWTDLRQVSTYSLQLCKKQGFFTWPTGVGGNFVSLQFFFFFKMITQRCKQKVVSSWWLSLGTVY